MVVFTFRSSRPWSLSSGRGTESLGRLLTLVLVVICATTQALADEAPAPVLPPEFRGVEINEHLGATLPLDLSFTDDEGQSVTLRDYFKLGRPVLLTLNYFECPMLCNLVLNATVEGLKGLDWTPGREFEVVTVSINHRENSALASAKKSTHIGALGRPEAAKGWHFLTGTSENIKALTEVVGFGYRWDPDQQQYAHGAAIFLVSPVGVLARYLYGIEFPSEQLRLALMEASQGKLGSVLDKIMLYCFHYVPSARRYEVYVWGAMRLGGVLTMAAVGTMLGVFWTRERRLLRLQSVSVST